MKKIYLSLVFAFSLLSISAQNFYDPDTIQEIKIYFDQSDWDAQLDQFFVNGDNERLTGRVVINGEPFDSVGIRYKGFSSVSVDRVKNPFNIKLDYLKNQSYDGIDKIKLSNVIQDPSFIREVFSYEIARNYMPASKANFAKVYINDTYWGLYTNVESVNKTFLSNHFPTVDNAFFKCNPEDLDLDGENSNLSDSPGANPDAYHELYDMRSDEGWEDLVDFIDVLNNEPDDIESVLNVDQTLWMHAFNYVLINFDSYIGYAQNYYLYRDANVFHPILWDLNMSLGSFRFTDASENFDGFSPRQAQTIDPLLHHNSVSIQPRPLMRNLFANDTYRKMYLAHIRTIVNDHFANESYKTRATELQTLIDDAVATDVNSFYGYDNFKENLTNTVSDLIEYPGIFDLMDNRSNYLLSYEGISDAPVISEIQTSVQNPTNGEDIWITVKIENGKTATLFYRFGGNGLFSKIEMKDDGNNEDGSANDGAFGGKIENVSNNIQYYLFAENDTDGIFAPERAAREFFTIQSKIGVGDIVINEFMASNSESVADGAGEFDDWIEIYNTTNNDIALGGIYISDKADNPDKFPLPDVVLPANGYQIIWADEDGNQGDDHANFKLSAGGEFLMLSYADSTVIDSTSYAAATTDLSWARKPNGTGTFAEGAHTFNMNNDFSITNESFVNHDLKLYPNPTNEALNITFAAEIPHQLSILDVTGKLIFKTNIITNHFTHKIDQLNAGLYFLKMNFEDGIQAERFEVY